mgnify:CR=1 FL=1
MPHIQQELGPRSSPKSVALWVFTILALFFSGRTFYFLVTEGSNPMATSVMLMWLCLFMMFRLKSSVNGQLSTS